VAQQPGGLVVQRDVAVLQRTDTQRDPQGAALRSQSVAGRKTCAHVRHKANGPGATSLREADLYLCERVHKVQVPTVLGPFIDSEADRRCA
jgi:hypothetical protein